MTALKKVKTTLRGIEQKEWRIIKRLAKDNDRSLNSELLQAIKFYTAEKQKQ